MTREYLEKHQWPLLAAILLLGLALRAIGLDGLPPFIDESGHLAGLDPIHPTFFALGKVLGQYIFRPVAAITGGSLYALRLLIALAGVATAAGLFLAGRQLGGVSAGLFSAAMWAWMPIVTFHDRLALHDPLISFFHVWSLVAMIAAMRGGDLRLAAVAGLLSGFGAMVKMPMAILTGSCLALGFAAIPRAEWSGRIRTIACFAAGFAAPFTILIPNWQLLFPAAGTYSFGIGASAVTGSLLAHNLAQVWTWLSGYNSLGFPVLAAVCGAAAVYRRDPLRLLLLALFAAPILAMSALLSAFFSRYLLAALIPLVLLIGITAAEFVVAPDESENARA